MTEEIAVTWEQMAGLLRREFRFCHGGKWNGKQVIRGIALWDGVTEPEKEYLYLNLSCSAAGVSAQRRPYLVTLIPASGAVRSGEESIAKTSTGSRKPAGTDSELPAKSAAETWEDKPAGCVLYCGTQTPLAAANRVLQLYHECLEWQHVLRRAARQAQDLQQVVDLCRSYLHFGTAIVNSAYEIGMYADSRDVSRSWKEFLAEDGRMTEESIEMLYLNGSFEETFEKKELSKYGLSGADLCYYYNFLDDADRYLGRILFIPEGDVTEKGILELMEFAAREAAVCFLATMREAAPTRLSKRLHQLFEMMLENEAVRRMEAEEVLGADGWGLTDGFLILKLVSNGNVQAAHTLAYYCRLLERDFPNVCTVERQGAMFCLVNLKEETGILRQKLPYFQREHLFLAGAGACFESFLDCGIHAREAEYALSAGLQRENGRWLYEFSEVSLDYCLKKMAEEYPIRDLMHPGLLILEEYDREHPGAELERTLRQYLEHQYHATETAELLHIHRTTLLYRLRRIRELTGILPEDARTALHLHLSYAMQAGAASGEQGGKH